MNNYIWMGLDKLKYLINQLKSKFMSNVNPTGTGSLSLNRKANTTVGTNSVAVGTNVEARGYSSHAEGYYTTASGESSHAEGRETTASYYYSHAEGFYTTASGMNSHAEGYEATASGDNSHAEGYYTIASGDSSHAEGYYTIASGDSSHAEGYYTTANGNYSHVEGKFNIKDMQNKYAHIIGNGTDNNYRSNAFTVDWDGKVEAQGDIVANKDSATPISMSGLNTSLGNKMNIPTYGFDVMLNKLHYQNMTSGSLNNANAWGIYVCNGNVTNTPVAGTYCIVMTVEIDNNTLFSMQIAVVINRANIYIRYRNNGTWSSWATK